MRALANLFCATAMICGASAAVGADDVRDYASGWPIALAEAACEGNEGILTQLANGNEQEGT